MSDTGSYYSINPHATDNKGPGNATRRLVFGWVTGGTTHAVQAGTVPYWQSAHSILRLMTVRGDHMVQTPAPEIELLRGKHTAFGPKAFRSTDTALLPGLTGTALEIIATFGVGSGGPTEATEFGVTVRKGATTPGVNIAYAPATQTVNGWYAGMAPQPQGNGTVTLRIFLDRSVMEVYTGGAAMTSRIMLGGAAEPTDRVALYCNSGNAKLLSLDAWEMGSMWGPVS